jgi:hypothetical protein
MYLASTTNRAYMFTNDTAMEVATFKRHRARVLGLMSLQLSHGIKPLLGLDLGRVLKPTPDNSIS